MNFRIFSENEWVYPDSPVTCPEAKQTAVLHTARGTDVSFQILTDQMFSCGDTAEAQLSLAGCAVTLSRLIPAHVPENSGPKTLTTQNYEEVSHFVTRKAPFDVYEMTVPIGEGAFDPCPAAFYVRIDVERDAPVGCFAGTLTLKVNGEAVAIPITLHIHSAVIPPLSESKFHMINWIYYDTLARDHGAEPYSDRYMEILGAYLENQRDMRNDYLMIPSGEPVRDENGRVIDFDFSHAKAVGALAKEYGFRYLLGGFVITWLKWDSPDLYLLWEQETEVKSLEAYRQLKLYFTRAWECVKACGWEDCYMQCLMDEPQFANDSSYRIVGAICRKCMPGITVHDPVESYTLSGGLDVWVVKQAVYEKYPTEFRALQDMGEEIWIYTCGFPAGHTMNRVIDLPLAASRLPMWMCYKYGCPGFLHWGYHCHNEEGHRDTCFRASRGRKFPAGNSFVVYNGDGKPWYSVRGHLQRRAACDYELLMLLDAHSREEALTVVESVCRRFDEYDPSPDALDEAHRVLLERLDAYAE